MTYTFKQEHLIDPEGDEILIKASSQQDGQKAQIFITSYNSLLILQNMQFKQEELLQFKNVAGWSRQILVVDGNTIAEAIHMNGKHFVYNINSDGSYAFRKQTGGGFTSDGECIFVKDTLENEYQLLALNVKLEIIKQFNEIKVNQIRSFKNTVFLDDYNNNYQIYMVLQQQLLDIPSASYITEVSAEAVFCCKNGEYQWLLIDRNPRTIKQAPQPWSLTKCGFVRFPQMSNERQLFATKDRTSVSLSGVGI